MGSSLSFIAFLLMIISATVRRACACADEINGTRKTKKLELVSSTSRRGARAAYHDEYPRDFGPRIAYTVSLVSDTCRPPIRQGGREMSAPRPCETNPFHQLARFTSYTKSNFSIYTKLFQLLLPCGINIVIGTLYICCLRMLSPRITFLRVWPNFEIILSSVCYLLVRDVARRFH